VEPIRRQQINNLWHGGINVNACRAVAVSTSQLRADDRSFIFAPAGFRAVAVVSADSALGMFGLRLRQHVISE
jgi:hypothetical protein